MLNDFMVRLQQSLGVHYVLERELGRGAMATVFQAKDVRHSRKVAIKAFAADSGTRNAAERFRQEIRIVASLSHPHIVPLIDSDTGEGVAWFAMPLAEGESLRDRLAREGQLPVDDAVRIALDVASALEYAHLRGVVHRDIKPENILLQQGQALVADFGVARTLEERSGSRLTAVGAGVGTPEYMSPEQLSGESAVDARADQYALGLVLYEMLAGNQAFAASTPQGVLARKLAGELLAVATVRPSVLPALDGALRSALAPVPADRFPDVKAFADAIRIATTSTTSSATGTAGAPAARRLSLRGRLVASGVVAGVAVAAAVALWPRVDARKLDQSLVAVFPFRAATPDASEWAEPLPDLLSTALDGTPGMRVSDPWSLWRGLRASQDAPARSPDPRDAGTLARERGAARYVLGSVRRDGGRIAVTVRVYLTAVSDSVEQTLAASAPEDSLTGLADRLAVAIMSRVGEPGGATGAPNVERYTTHSPEAMKAYLAARGALRRGLIDSADRAIDRALSLDSTFALALAQAVEVKTWAQFARGQPYAGLRELVARGRQFEDSLGVRNRLRLQLQDALIETNGPAAAELSRRLVELDSSDFEAWNVLSYVRMVHGWQYGAGASDALTATDRALQLDSTNALALTRRMWFAAQSGDLLDMRRQLARVRPAQLNGVTKGSELGLEILLAPDGSVDSLLRVVSASPTAVWVSAYRAVRATRPDRALRLANGVLGHAEAGAPARLAQNVVAAMTLATGHEQSLAVMLENTPFAANTADRHRFELGLVGSALVGISSDSVTKRALESLTKQSPIDSAVRLFQTRDIWQAGWLIAAYQASYGDTSVAKRWRDVMNSFPTAGAHPVDYVKSLQADLDGRLAARGGDTHAALAHESRALRLWSVHTENTFEFSPEPQIRFLTARLLRTEHLVDSASKLFRSLTPPSTWLVALTPLAWIELGEIAAEERDCARAAPLFESALTLLDSTAGAVAKARERALAGRRRCGGGR